MTDLSTTNLQHLLAEATPGPWEYITGDSPDGRCIGNPGSMTMCIGVDANGHGSSCSDHDLTLAAAAPDLAQEALRMREYVKGLILAMETKAANNEWQDPATIASYLKEIVLGDHDE